MQTADHGKKDSKKFCPPPLLPFSLNEYGVQIEIHIPSTKMEALGLKLVSTGCGGLRPEKTVVDRRRRDFGRPPGRICCISSSSSTSSSSFPDSSSGADKSNSNSNSSLSRTQTYALLKQQLAVAARLENYKEAARIRDSLRSFEDEEPVLHLRRLIKEAVKEERFQDAAKYRDELVALAPYSLLKCSSDASTLGIRVQVRSVYIEGRSQPLKDQYFFAYRIRITNNSDRPVQLLRRHWVITDGCGKTENFWGTGVVGEQPVILPRTGFEYSSACPLRTPNGRMEGDFEMKQVDKLGSSTFNVAIAPFSLTILEDDDGDTM